MIKVVAYRVFNRYFDVGLELYRYQRDTHACYTYGCSMEILTSYQRIFL